MVPRVLEAPVSAKADKDFNEERGSMEFMDSFTVCPLVTSVSLIAPGTSPVPWASQLLPLVTLCIPYLASTEP